MKKFLILSMLVFFMVIWVTAVGVDYTAGDHPYYVATGQFGDGHDLTILILRPMAAILGDYALPIFINFMFVLSVYFMLKPFIRYPEWAFLLAPITPLGGIYAQIFAISLFNFMLGFYFRDKKKIAILFLILVFLAHWWAGLFVASIFGLYLLLFDRSDKKIIFSTISIAGLFFLFMFNGIGFLAETRSILPTSYDSLTTAGFFLLISRNLSFLILSIFGLWRLYVKSRDFFKNFFKINLMLFLIPLFIAFILPTSHYWNWRVFYFMPFLALVSILFSYLFEGKTETKD